MLHIHVVKHLRLRNAPPNLDLQWLNFTSVFHFPCPDFTHIDQIYNKPTTCQSQPHLFTLQATTVPETYIWALSVSSQVSDSLSTLKAPGEQKLTRSSCRPLSPNTRWAYFYIFVSADVFSYILKFPLNNLWFWINTKLSSKEAANESHIQAFSPPFDFGFGGKNSSMVGISINNRRGRITFWIYTIN